VFGFRIISFPYAALSVVIQNKRSTSRTITLQITASSTHPVMQRATVDRRQGDGPPRHQLPTIVAQARVISATCVSCSATTCDIKMRTGNQLDQAQQQHIQCHRVGHPFFTPAVRLSASTLTTTKSIGPTKAGFTFVRRPANHTCE
jgi:hypothetical protein